MHLKVLAYAGIAGNDDNVLVMFKSISEGMFDGIVVYSKALYRPLVERFGPTILYLMNTGV
jgi:hypothetical protein